MSAGRKKQELKQSECAQQHVMMATHKQKKEDF